MKSFICFILLLAISTITTEHVSFDGYKVWSISPKTPEQITKLREWEKVTSIDFWNELNSVGKPVKVMVAPISQESFKTFLLNEEIPNEITIENTEVVFQAEREQLRETQERLAREKAEGRATLDFNHFWTSTEISDYINYLVNFHGNVCRAKIIGHTIQGQLMRSVEISMHGEVDGSRPIIFVDAGVHAREWAAFMVGVYLLHNLCEHSYDYYDILYNVDWVIIPMVNPDGYEYTHSTYRMWRKNRRINTNPECPGVDGNRNYANQWRPVTNQCSEAYSGTEPFSEPEIQAVRSIMDKFGSAIKIYASVHSYGEYVLYPWGYDEILIDNWEQHQEVGDRYAAAVYGVNGRNYTVGNAAIVLYPAFGASDDYMAYAGVPLSYTIELTGGPGNGFDLPADMIQGVIEESWLGFRQFGLYASEHAWNN